MKKFNILVLIIAISIGEILSHPAPEPKPILGGLLDSVSSVLLGSLNSSIVTISNLAAQFQAMLQDLMNQDIASISSSVPIDVSTLEETLAQVAGALPAVQDAIQSPNSLQGADAISSTLTELIDNLDSTLNIVNSVNGEVPSNTDVNGLNSTAQSIISQLQGIAQQNPSTSLSQTMGDELLKQIIDFVIELANEISSLIDNYNSVVTENPFAALIKDVETSADPTELQAALDEFPKVFTSSIEPSLSQLNERISNLENQLSGLSNSFENSANDAISQLEKQLNDLSSTAPALSEPEVQQKITELIANIRAMAEEASNSLQFDTLLSQFSATNTDVVTQIAEQAQNIMNDVSAQAAADPSEITCLIDILTGVITLVEGTVGALVQSIQDASDKQTAAINGIPTIITEVSDDLSSKVQGCLELTNPADSQTCIIDAIEAESAGVQTELDRVVEEAGAGGTTVDNYANVIETTIANFNTEMQEFADAVGQCAAV